MEKLKENKKMLIIAAVVIVAIIALVVCAVVFLKPSYKKQINEFGKALDSEEKMEKFLDKYTDYRAFYAMDKVSEDKDVDMDDEKAVEKAFKSEYKKAKKSDYKDEEFVDEVKSMYKYLTSVTNSYEEMEIKIKDIGKAEKCEEFPMFKQVKFTIEMSYQGETQDTEMSALFYKGKFVSMYE